MRVPQLNSANKNTIFTQQFLGYNHNLRTGEGEFYDMKNMSLDHFPVITTRHGEKDEAALTGRPNGLHEYQQDTLMAVCGNVLHVGITKDSPGSIVPTSAAFLSDSEKSFATIGVYTVIMPDKVIYNARTGELSSIVQTFTSAEYGGQYLMLQMIPCDIEGVSIDYVEAAEAPADTAVYWYDSANNVYKKYSTSTEQWIQIETPYVKVIPRISSSASAYIAPTDALNANAVAAKTAISDYFATLMPLDTLSLAQASPAEDDDWWDHIVYGTGVEDETAYVVLNLLKQTSLTAFTVKTRCPDLNHLVALNNRVWGVSNSTHEIFACKLGDPTQWYNYAGIASDSYAVSLGSADEVTAGVAYNNYVHFFTEDKIIKFYGDYPSNYQMYTAKADGVISGGHDTVAQVEGVLFYVSPIGVMAYDGSIPVFRGQKFAPGYLTGKKTVAGRDGTKYCLSVSKDGEADGVYVYDTLYGLWSKGGDQIYAETAELDNSLCFLNNQSRLITLYDKSRTTDLVAMMGDNIFLLDGREQTTF